MKKLFVLLFASLFVMTACDKDENKPGNGNTNEVADNGAIDALYSVSPTKQVRFSKGNLQYKATTGVWRFAEHQWERIGTDNESISEFYGGWIDLFGWATSGWDCGNTYYMPYDHAFVDDYELGCGYGPLPSTDYDLVGEWANCDWGVYNAISNGGNKPGMWRTLTADEWKYLFQNRPNASAKYGVASIEGSNGLVVLPDEWTLPQGVTFKPGMGSGDGPQYYAQKNNYTEEQWLLMESAGAVFLPAGGGRREYSEVTYVGEVGRYWSVTRVTGMDYFDSWCSYALYFDSEAIYPADMNSPRDSGRSVRLVADAN